MDFLIAANSVPLADRDVAPASGTPQWATDGDPTTSVPATDFPAYIFNAILSEITTAITAGGLTLNGNDWTQLSQVLAKLAPLASPAISGTPTTPDISGSWQTKQVVNAESVSNMLFASLAQPVTSSGGLTVPAGARYLELTCIAAGGGGGGCQSNSSTSTSLISFGSGGGAGSAIISRHAVTSTSSIALTIGAGGAESSAGGDTYVTIDGSVVVRAAGGAGGLSYTGGTSGGAGGAPTLYSGQLVAAYDGSDGYDGQAGNTMRSPGNGAPGFLGMGAGRAGSQGGRPGTSYGAAGGGAYDSSFTGNRYYGGAGYQGAIFYRWIF
ncbi:hypothetical protein AA23498_1352 [Acetobacter nitrogenifigens DSM 23921 = NBRC 105050]|uniref:Carbohydrate kinase n=1 Tax=Acetobacter nitrogenifigens DSM 23921 = NBRC 105050 TaxID=1120919 RepID=A0A511X5E8_9PROT|nr:hypothetical protein [Acetobacter nitrogenifigens]GBQ92056.1 hypothetical protein AA23498_1352 [Acetobacter nitrogenifigens DSM 23921 = NBRC 105050]GEN58140.1 carbohydrate kinase [Acetobacter nitrogenifigens DSM 23921 = NBRC 105050]